MKMASPLIVKTCVVGKVEDHPNADRLDIVTVKGWNCVVKKNSITAGQTVVYIPIDSVLSDKLNNYFFPPESKIKIKNNRIKTIKIRGVISQGLVISVSELINAGFDIPTKIDKNVKDILGITKYEIQEKIPNLMSAGLQKSKKQINQNFKKYAGINHFKNYPDSIYPETEVVITEKIHGTNYRSGYVPIYDSSLFKHIYKYVVSFINRKRYIHPGYDFVYGSHNVQLQEKYNNNTNYYKKNVYVEITERYNLNKLLDPGYVVYGEIYGDGIQKNFNYGLKNGIDFVVFDVMKDGKYLNFDEMMSYVFIKRLPYAPILYRGPFGDAPIDDLVSGPSVLCPDQKVREGIVIKTTKEMNGHMGRCILKYINSDYLMLKGNTEFH